MRPRPATCSSSDALFVGPDRAAGRLDAAFPRLFPQPRLPGAAGRPRAPPHSGNLKGPADEVPGALAGRLEIPVPVAALLGDEAKPPVGRPSLAGPSIEAKARGGVEAFDQRHIHEQLNPR